MEQKLHPVLAVRVFNSGKCFGPGIAELLRALGAEVLETSDALRIRGAARFRGCTVDTRADHRLAMAASIAACRADGPIRLTDGRCVAKSDPQFWNSYHQLGGLCL